MRGAHSWVGIIRTWRTPSHFTFEWLLDLLRSWHNVTGDAIDKDNSDSVYHCFFFIDTDIIITFFFFTTIILIIIAIKCNIVVCKSAVSCVVIQGKETRKHLLFCLFPFFCLVCTHSDLVMLSLTFYWKCFKNLKHSLSRNQKSKDFHLVNCRINAKRETLCSIKTSESGVRGIAFTIWFFYFFLFLYRDPGPFIKHSVPDTHPDDATTFNAPFP